MERLQKLIAQAGVTSRRKAEELITQGRVKLNGQVVTELGTKATKKDKIEVDGVPIYKEEPVYFLFYKPEGVISTVTDDKDRRTVTDYFTAEPQRLYPVGRLDYDTSGALLMTNDGDLTNKMTHPSFEVTKRYLATVKGVPSSGAVARLEKGVTVDGELTAPAKVEIVYIDKKTDTAQFYLTIHEGRNHQVKKMFESIGSKVTKLKREEFAFLNLDGLRIGDYRPLKRFEVNKLYELAK